MYRTLYWLPVVSSHYHPIFHIGFNLWPPNIFLSQSFGYSDFPSQPSPGVCSIDHHPTYSLLIRIHESQMKGKKKNLFPIDDCQTFQPPARTSLKITAKSIFNQRWSFHNHIWLLLRWLIPRFPLQGCGLMWLERNARLLKYGVLLFQFC